MISNHRIAQVASLIGLFLLTYAMFAFDQNMPLPSLWSLFPVGGAALLILFATPDTFCGKLLSLRPFSSV
jgi:peptidoglycan/LPS O-acetylase OafA/YrhL